VVFGVYAVDLFPYSNSVKVEATISNGILKQ